MVTTIIPYNVDRGFLDKCVKSIDYGQMILSCSDASVSVNFNNALKDVKTEFVKFISEDDYFLPGGLRALHLGMGSDKWVCANSYRVFEGRVIEFYKPDTLDLEENLIRNRIDGGTTLYRTELLQEIGGMDETLWTGEEYDMHLKLMFMGHMPGYVNQFVYCHRIHSQQKSRIYRKQDKNKRDEAIRSIQARYSNQI